ncbi:MAG: FHA domain-containing protein [Candidatus Promineifilaceae bacterium]|nr:FHA domain-containing protein [Candidatus Promineifilaceae bacterium]
MDPESNYKLILQEGPLPSAEFELSKTEIIIGRAPSVDIVISHSAVSGRHALLTREGNQFTIEDLNSTNGTFVNGTRVLGLRSLKPGSELRLGQSITLYLFAPLTSHDTAVQDGPVDATMLEDDLTAVKAAALGSAAAAEDEQVTRISAPEEVESPLASMPVPPPKTAAPEPPPDGATMIYDDFLDIAAMSPAQLQVAVAGAAPQTYILDKAKLSIGRADDNDIVVNSKIVSRHHATLEKVGDGYQIVPYPEAGNPVLYEGRPLSGAHRLGHNDLLRIGGLDPGSMVTMTYLSPRESVDTTEAATIHFGDKTQLTIGRDPSNDVVLDTPAVSRYHAQIERVGQRYRVRDLRSSNGTFVNGVPIEGDHWLQPDDAVRIGPHRFVMGEDRLNQYDESQNLKVEAINLNKWVRKDLNILKNISLVFQPKEFVVVVGQSGGGKSTLVDAIAGYRPATDGDVFVNELNVYDNFDAIRNDIGFVPQRDIIHMELTVHQALNYAAQLRMPPDTTKEERNARIDEVLDDLDLAHRRDVQISGLSGGQQKRVSIGVELLTKPGLFYLDEPTSGLDPGTETSLMQLMRRLADQGRTITLITHATKNVMLADKVVFLARGGFLTWFGPPDEALAYFDQYRSERDRRARDIEFDEIYSILDDTSKGSPEDWGARFRQHPAYTKYISTPLQDKDQAPTGQFRSPDAVAIPKKKRNQVSSWSQFLILSSRNLKILTRDRFGLILMLAAPPLVSLLDVILALVLGRDPFDFTEGSMPNVMITLFLLTVYGVMVGGLAQMREIVKEQDVYKRERLVNLRIFPYVMSKIWVAAILAVYASLVYMIVHYVAFDMPGGTTEFILMLISLTLATMAGMMLGLFASALAPNANSAPLIVVLLMLPQIVLGGALVPLPEAITAPISTRWAFQAFMGITGVGSDVAADACWTQLDEATQKALTLEQKDENCLCLGTNTLRQDSCDYPGVGKFYDPVIDQPAAGEFNEPPPEEPVQPEEPVFPPEPVEPADQSDDIAMAQYREDFLAWRAESERIKEEFDTRMDVFEAELELYQVQRQDYEMRRAESLQSDVQREVAIKAAVLPAEELIRQFYPGFGWTYVNKNDSAAYRSMILETWAAQLVIIFILFVLIIFLLKRKDAVQ